MSFNGDFWQQGSDEVPAGENPNGLKTIDRFNQAFERGMAAFESFNVADAKFSNSIANAVQVREEDLTCKVTLSDDDFAAYMATVVEVIAADKELEEHSHLVSHSTRSSFRRAIQNIEGSRVTFEASVSDGRINAEKLTPFFDAIIAFRKARIDFFDANIAAFEKHRAED